MKTRTFSKFLLLMTGAYFPEAIIQWVCSWRIDIWNWEPWTDSSFPSDNPLINAQPGNLENVCFCWVGERWRYCQPLSFCSFVQPYENDRRDMRLRLHSQGPVLYRIYWASAYLLLAFKKISSPVWKRKHCRLPYQPSRLLDD